MARTKGVAIETIEETPNAIVAAIGSRLRSLRHERDTQNVIRWVLREDRSRGISLAINEYEPETGSSSKRGAHSGFEYGFVLEGVLTVELENVTYQLKAGDLIAFESRRPHRFWNNGSKRVRTLWINFRGD